MMKLMKWTIVLVALAVLPTLAVAQPAAMALPSVDSPGGLQAHLEKIIKLQEQQLQASVPAQDESRFCYIDGKAYSEGAVWANPKGKALRCQRDAISPLSNYGTPAPRLSWVLQS